MKSQVSSRTFEMRGQPPLGWPHWWQWPTILSLDAPTVALLWQAVLARVAHSPLAWPHRFVLGASVWLAYAADRWIEAWRLRPDQIQTQRHYFSARWRWPLLGLWIAVLAADLAVSFLQLHTRELIAGVLLLGPTLAYLLSHQFAHRDAPWRAPKELCIALLFGGGASVFIVAQPTAQLGLLAVPLALFVGLCFANCALISLWEREVDEIHGQVTLAAQLRRRHTALHVLPWLLALASVVALPFTAGVTATVVACAASSGVLLGLIDRAERRFGRQAARVLADVALMTPVFLLLPIVARR